MSSKKVTHSMTEEQAEVLSRISDSNGVSQSKLIRKGLYHYLTSDPDDLAHSNEGAKAFDEI